MKILLIDAKNVAYFILTFSYFFVTADDYQYSSKPADF